MYTYYCLFFFVFFFYSACYKCRNQKNVYLLCVFVLLMFVSGVRDGSVGGDVSNHYLSNFSVFGKTDFLKLLDRTKYGYLFAFLCKFVYYIDSSPQSFLVVTSILNLLFVAIFIRRYSSVVWLSVFIYIAMGFYTNTFNSVRSSMSLGIGLMAMKYVLERKFWKFLFIYMIALEVHQTIFPLFFLYFLYQKQLSLKYIVICIALCFLISQASTYVNVIATIAYLYDPGAYQDIGDSYSGGYKFFALLSLMTIVFYLLLNKSDNPKVRLFLHCMLIASCVQAFATYYTVLVRVGMFFYIVIIVLFPIVIQSLKLRIHRVIAYYITIIMFLLYFKMTIMTPLPQYDGSNYQGTLPYITFWEKN